MLTKYAAAATLSVEWIEQPAHAHDHTPWLHPHERTFRTAHRASFQYERRPGYLYVRSRAISSRCNDNYDEFPAEEIKLGFRSFVGKPVFVNHKNDDHRRARGVIIDAALHEDTNPDGSPDTWCEVLMEVDAVRFPKLAKAILAGEVDRTSMGTDVAYSKCSFCGNKAATPLDYCQHIPKLKGKRIRRRQANGSQEDVLVREICYGLSFFENSLLVEEPADPTAYFLGVEGDGVTATAGVVTEAMLRAAGPKTASTFKVTWDWKKHQPPHGNDFTRKYPQGFEIEAEDEADAKEKLKTEHRFNPWYLVIEKTGVRKEAKVCGEFSAEDYFPTECPSWQPYYYASWIKPDGKILAVTQHDDAPGKQQGAFTAGWLRMMVTDYPNNPYLQAEMHTWPATQAQQTTFSKLARELECKRTCVIQVAEAETGNGTYNIPPATLSSFLSSPVPEGGKGAGSVRDFYDRFSSLHHEAGKACPGTGEPASKDGRDRCPVCGFTVYTDNGVFLRHEGERDLGSSRAPGRPADWLSGMWASKRAVCPGCGVGGSVEQAVAASGQCKCGTALYLADDRGEPLQTLAMAPPWSQEEEDKHPRGQPGNPGQFRKKDSAPAEAPGKSKPERKLRTPNLDRDAEYEPPFVPKKSRQKPFQERKAADYQPKKLSPEERAKHPVGSQENPRITQDHNEAIESLWNGEWVELKRPEEVTLLAENLGKLKGWIKAQNARDKDEWVAQGGDPARYEDKGFNLCKITVPGTNLFCEQTKDIPRIQMPQLKANNPLPGSKAETMKRDNRGEIDLNPMFKTMLKRVGINVKDKDKDGKQLTRPLNKLKATQNELQGEKIGFFVDLLRQKGPGAIEGSVFVSRDGYIVDGHHRWAGMLAYDLENGRAGDVDMAVDIIDADIIDILRMANDFCAYYGLPSQDAKTWAGYDPDAKKAASLMRIAAETMDLPMGDYSQAPIWTINYRPQDEARIRALAPHIQNGPNYRRGVIENLKDYSLFAGRGDDQAAELYLLYAEGKTVREAQDIIEGRLPFEGRRRLANGETKAPADVDTLRDAECPVCGEEQSYDGETCLVCGFVKPPDMFMDPDLEKAQQVDLRQQEDDIGQPGGEQLSCDQCGAKFPKSPEAPGGQAPDPTGAAKPQPDPAEPHTHPGEDHPDAQHGPEAHPDKPHPHDPEAEDKPAPGEKVDVEVDDGTDDDQDDEELDEEGKPKPKKKKPPFVKGSARTAAAATDEIKPHLQQSPSLPHVTDKEVKAEEAGKGDEMPDTAPEAGDTCPECGKGTLRPDTPAATKQEEVPPGKKPEDGAEKKDAPPWAKDEKSKGKDQKESTRRNGVEMRPALAALAEQQQTIDHQARQIQALKQAVKGIARLAGVDEHPKFAALMKIADENNPVQPVPDPPSEAPSETTDQALAPAGTDDPTTIGASPVTDVAADAVTDVMSTDVVLDEPLDLNEMDVQAPVAGTEGPRPLDEVKTETEIRVGDPNNPDTMFPLQGDFANRATTGSREGRTIASMRLARLRIQSGIANGDDLTMATQIAGSNVSDEVIQAEINTLSQVMRTAGRAPQGARNLVPRSASRQRSAPSLSEPFAAPEIQVVSAVEDSEILFE